MVNTVLESAQYWANCNILKCFFARFWCFLRNCLFLTSLKYIYKIRFYVIKCWSWGKDLDCFSFVLLTEFSFSSWLLFLPVLAPVVASSRSSLGSTASAPCPETRINSASSEIRTAYEANWQHPFCPSAHRWTWGIADGLWMCGILTLATRLRSCTCILKPCRKDERLSYPVCSIQRYVDRPKTTVYLLGMKSKQYKANLIKPKSKYSILIVSSPKVHFFHC